MNQKLPKKKEKLIKKVMDKHESSLEKELKMKIENENDVDIDKYLRRIDKYDDHINRFTLHFKNKSYENEWRIRDINERKISVIMIYILKIAGDCIWTWGKNKLWDQI